MILDKDALKKIAGEVIAKYSSNDTIRTDIVHIAEGLGFTVGEFTKKADFNSFIFYFPHKKKKHLDTSATATIGVYTKGTVQVKRFLIAYNLSHYLLYCKEKKGNNSFVRKNYEGSECNIEAEYLAICLLLPAEKFKMMRERLPTKDEDEARTILSTAFAVEEDVVAHRLIELCDQIFLNDTDNKIV